jgi:hypothetical protein
MVNHRGRLPVGVQVIVCFQERAHCRPVLVQEGGDIVSIGGQSRIVFRNWDVSDFHFFPSFRLICLEDLVERLSTSRCGQVL